LAKLEGLFEASSRVSIIAMDPSGIITSFNKGAENLLGYTKEEVLYQKTPLIIHSKEEIFKRGEELSTIFKTKIEGFEVLIALAKTGAHDTQEWTQIRKDGSRFPVQLTVTAIQDKKRDKIIGYLAVGMEISKIKKVEKEAKTLLQVTKDQNDRLINFAHIVSHNLKSHSGNFSMLLELFLIENEWLKNNEMIRLLKRASGNLSETIEHLNEVVQINTAMNQSLVTLNLNDVVTKTLDGLSGIASEASVTIRNAIDTKATVLGVPAYLDSILLNFISNGIKYRSPKRKSHVILSTNKEDDFLVLNIEDNGLGIDLKKYEQKLFGMYKTFHHNKDARGIGLFISKNQVEALGGKIKVESKVDKGTTFKIYMKYEKN